VAHGKALLSRSEVKDVLGTVLVGWDATVEVEARPGEPEVPSSMQCLADICLVIESDLSRKKKKAQQQQPERIQSLCSVIFYKVFSVSA
jgi:pyruvate kinase